MGRRGAYPATPQNVCDAVKRKDIVCLPARSHAFNHEAKMLARKDIFARPSIAQPRIARKRQSRLLLPTAKSLRILYHIFALFQALHSYFNFLRPAPTEYPPMSTAPNRTHLLRQFTELRITFSAYRPHLRLHLVNVPNSC